MPETKPSTAPPAQPPDARRHARALRIGGLLALTFLVIFGVVCVRKGWYEPPQPGESRKRKNRGTDFTAYYSAGELARTGRDLYDWRSSSTPFRPYIYPPTFAILPMAPLSLLPHNAALAVFYWLNVGCLIGSLWLLRKMLWPPGAESAGGFWRLPEVGLFVAVLMCGRFLDSNLKLGNANLFILFFTTLGLYGLHRGRPFAGGLAIAYATAVKATPGLFGLYFLWSRRGWAMTGGAVGLALFLLIVPAAVLGWPQTAGSLRSFVDEAGAKFSMPVSSDASDADADGEGDSEEGPRAIGVSLRGSLLKLLSPTVSMHHRDVGDVRSVNVLDLAPETVSRAATILSLLILGLTIWLTAGSWARTHPTGLALSWSLVTLTMLLISPLTRKAHCVLVLIPAVVLIALLQQERLAGFARKAAWAALAILPAATLLTAEGLAGERAAEFFHAMGTSTWAMVALYVATAAALWSGKASSDRSVRSDA